MFLEINHGFGGGGSVTKFQYPLWIDVFGNQKCWVAKLRRFMRFSILFGSMFLEISLFVPSPANAIAFQYPLWIDVFGNKTMCWLLNVGIIVSVSSLDRCFWKYLADKHQRQQFRCFSILFGSMFLEIKPPRPAEKTQKRFSILFGSMFLEIQYN